MSTPSTSSSSARVENLRKRPRLGGAPLGAGLDVAVLGGAGRVGLPLALALASRGHRVRALDSDGAALSVARRGAMPFLEVGGEELLRQCFDEYPDRLQFSSDLADSRECDVVVVTSGVPVDEHLNPHLAVLEAEVERLRPFLREGQTVVLRSVVAPGTSMRLASMMKGIGVGIAFCGERLAEGTRARDIFKVPQIIAGSDSRALEHARGIFRPIGVDIVELELLEAEVAPLFHNAWRYVAFGTANQFYHIATAKGLDFGRIRAAIAHRYRRAAGFPSAGLTAGPRLFRDTMQLAAYCRHTFSLGHAAMLVNETMPDCLLDQAKRELARKRCISHGVSGGAPASLAGVRCGVLGMAFKPDSDDPTESLAFKLRRLLIWEGAEVLCSDANMKRDDFVDEGRLLAQSDVVFIGCPHRSYKELGFREEQLVLDCWGAISGACPSLTIHPGLGAEAKRYLSNGHTGEALSVAVVGGAGHVGLPLSLVLADRGHRVVVIDTDARKLDSIRAGAFPFLEAGGSELLAKCLKEHPERLELTTQYSAIKGCDVVVITIGTPVDEHLNPNFGVIEACMGDLRPHLRSGHTLLLRSTLFPGSSARVISSLRAAGLSGVGVSFCPERIAQGEAMSELLELPQIISGSDSAALEHAKALFRPLGVDLVELELQEAEAAKLFLNAWRYVEFGTANQFYHIAGSKGLDFERIRSAIVSRYPGAAGFPRSGFTAGPCLFKDTMQLAAYCRHTFSLGHAAMLVNETMPDVVVELARRELAKSGQGLAGAKCGVLGMAFKPNNDDVRESLAFKLRRVLLAEGAEVLCCDVYIRRDGFVSVGELLERCELLFVGCPHREYLGLEIGDRHRVFDCWGSGVGKPKVA